MATETEEYLSVSSFKVAIDGMNWERFETVSGIGIDLEDIAFQSDKRGMMNRPGRFNARDLSLVRPFKKDRQLYDWLKKIKEGKNERKSGSVILFDDEEKEVVRFNFFGAWPKSWSGPILSKDNSGNSLLREEITLSVQDVELA